MDFNEFLEELDEEEGLPLPDPNITIMRVDTSQLMEFDDDVPWEDEPMNHQPTPSQSQQVAAMFQQLIGEDEPPENNPEPRNDDIQDPTFDFEPVMFKPTKILHKEMITHVLWPRFLPRFERQGIEDHETALIDLMVDVVDWFQLKHMVSWIITIIYDFISYKTGIINLWNK